MEAPEIARIAAHASTLAERRSGVIVRVSAPEWDADNRFRRWCDIASAGDEERFKRLLDRDSLTPVEARALLGRAQPSQTTALPSWIDSLRLCSRAFNSPSGELAHSLPEALAHVPFAEVLRPLVSAAFRELSRKASVDVLSTSAREALELNLLEKLSSLSSELLQRLFVNHRKRIGWSTEGATASRRNDAPVYGTFVERMLNKGFLDVLRDYPVLARLVSIAIQNWLANNAEFLGRLEEDREGLVRRFAGEQGTAAIAALQTGISDPHNGGRSVVILELSSGTRVVYKPRSLRPEHSFNHLLKWINSRSTPPHQKTLHVWDCGEYGWMEYAEPGPCKKEAEVRDFYTRAGSMLCLVYCLGGTDFHLENVIASGTYPVLIDLETLLQPRLLAQHAGLDAARAASFEALFHETVLGTGLVPLWQQGSGKYCFDPSGFTSSAGQSPFRLEAAWINVNSDSQDVVTAPMAVRPRHNLPILNGESVPVHRYVEEFTSGFSRTYDLMRRNRNVLLGPAGPLECFRSSRVRVLFRPSAIYDHIQRTSLRPAMLKEGADRSIHLDLLARALVTSNRVSPMWPLREAETAAMEGLDIPAFSAAAESTCVRIGSDVIPLAESGWRRTLDTIDRLDTADHHRQVRIIQNAIRLRYPAPGVQVRPRRCTHGRANPPNEIAFVTEAVRIAEEIEACALPVGDRAVTWWVVEPLPGTGRFTMRPANFGLYRGIGGICLFMAAVTRVAGRYSFRPLIDAALRPLLCVLRQKNGVEEIVDTTGVGAACGVGSIIYALVRMGELLGRPDLVAASHVAASRLRKPHFEPDERLDVSGGTAGLLLSLLALHKNSRSGAVLEKAHQCGNHLVNQQHRTSEKAVPSESDGRGWAQDGNTGIAYSLLRLHVRTKDVRFLDAARRYAQADRPSTAGPAYAVDCTALPDLASSHEVASQTSRDAANPLLDLPVNTRFDCAQSIDGTDTLHAGTIGLVQVLMELAGRVSDRQFRSAAHRLASQTLAKAHVSGGYRLMGKEFSGIYSPDLQYGTAGIGYIMLRLGSSSALPSTLLWT